MRTDSRVMAGCVICGTRTFDVVCSAAEVADQFHYVNTFHRRRLVSTNRKDLSDDALADRSEFTQDYAAEIVSCTHCRLVYRTPRPSAQAITQAYQEDHYGSERLDALFAAQRELYRSKARLLRKWLPRQRIPRVVEVGSFVGGFLAAGREQKWEIVGVDPGEEVGIFCKEKGLPVFHGTLTETPVARGVVDCVAIWNTFDQLPYPQETLKAAHQILRPGGVLAIRVPNGECFRWAMKRLPSLPRPIATGLRVALVWNNLLAFPYLYGYSVRTLERLLGAFGFTRLAVRPDVLLPLADKQTKPWAIWEERLIKGIHRLAARVEMLRPASPMIVAPWLDVYFRLTNLSEFGPHVSRAATPSSLTSLWGAVAQS